MNLSDRLQRYVDQRMEILLNPETPYDPPLVALQQIHMLNLLRNVTGIGPLDEESKQREEWFVDYPVLKLFFPEAKIERPGQYFGDEAGFTSKEIAEGLVDLPEEIRKELFEYLGQLNENSSLEILSSPPKLPDPIASIFLPVLKAWRKEGAIPFQFGVSSKYNPDGHGTLPKRHADSNTFLAKYYAKEKCLGSHSKAIFIGGSVGFTASDFHRSMEESGVSSWNVLNLDLATPEDILTSHFKKDGNAFVRPDFIEYIQADMRSYDFGRENYDFVDFCNSSGYLADLNERSNVARRAWHSLKVGGIIRISPPICENLFEQILCLKTGPGYWDFEPLFLSNTGKTLYLNRMPEKALEESNWLTERYLSIWKALRESKKLTEYPTLPSNVNEAFLQDMAFISPIGYILGVPDTSLFFDSGIEEDPKDPPSKKFIRTQLKNLAKRFGKK